VTARGGGRGGWRERMPMGLAASAERDGDRRLRRSCNGHRRRLLKNSSWWHGGGLTRRGGSCAGIWPSGHAARRLEIGWKSGAAVAGCWEPGMVAESIRPKSEKYSGLAHRPGTLTRRRLGLRWWS